MQSVFSHSSARRRGNGPVLIAALIAAVPSTCVLGAATPASYGVIERWKLGGSGGWDYMTLDSSGKQLFIARGDRIEVVDTTTGKSLGTIPDLKGAHGVALDERSKRGYVSDGKGNAVVVFDLDTLKTIRQLPVPGQNPDAILFEPAGKHVFTFNGRSKDVTVLDAADMRVVKTIPVPDKPEFAADDGHGQIFANIESEPGQMVVIDSVKLEVKHTWPLPGCNSPSGLALDRTHHRLFSVCDDNVMVVTASDTGRQVAKITIGAGPDAVTYDAQHGLVFSSNGEGSLTVVKQNSADSYSVAKTVATQKGARTMALDPSTGRAYTVTSEFGPAPAATADAPHPRPAVIPGTFSVIVVGSQ